MTADDPLWPRASAWLAAFPAAPRLGLVGVPLSRTSISPSGAHETPAAVRGALRRFPCYHAGLDADLAPAVDLGDLDVAHLDGLAAVEAVETGLRALRPVELLVLLGGDNAVTRPALRATAPDLSRAGLLTLDAHHDVRGTHAGWTNGTPVRGLVEDGLPPGNVVQVGIADLSNSREYRSWCDEQGVTVVGVREARERGTGRVVQEHLDRLAERCDVVLVDLDVDVVDRAFAPGCPGSRPGGLLPSDLLDAAAAAGRHPVVRAVDVVEVDAASDPSGATVDLAAMCLLSAAAGLTLRL